MIRPTLGVCLFPSWSKENVLIPRLLTAALRLPVPAQNSTNVAKRELSCSCRGGAVGVDGFSSQAAPVWEHSWKGASRLQPFFQHT